MRRKVLLSLLSVLLVFTSVPLLACRGEVDYTAEDSAQREQGQKGQGIAGMPINVL